MKAALWNLAYTVALVGMLIFILPVAMVQALREEADRG
jgi:hypothetical protein